MASRWAAGPILFVALTLSACGWFGDSPVDEEQRVERGPREQAAEIRPERIRVEATQVAPGDELELFFPQEDVRGVYYWLELDVDDTWDERYFAYAVSRSYNTDGDPHTVPTGEEKGADDAGMTGPVRIGFSYQRMPPRGGGESVALSPTASSARSSK